ncbi:hypothetical protein Tco_0990030 [Tanacetum coccineum]|uniref:Reverse transcriptase domain-containing protein n=1 Tax=Tanacetum coccineum TaxID=301880 RepID=A0ABQ5EVA4_9ASTR
MENTSSSSSSGSPTSPISRRVQKLDTLLESLGKIIPPPARDVSNVIDHYLGGMDLGKYFVKQSKLTYDKEEGSIMFEKNDERVTFKMPHKVKRFKDIEDLNTNNIPPFFIASKRDEEKREGYVIQGLAIQHSTLELFDLHRSLIVPLFSQSVAPSVGPATISPVQTKSTTFKPLNLLFWHDKLERNDATISEEYDEEREMESRPERARETSLILRTRSSRARRQRERVVEFEEVPNREGGRVGRNTEGGRPSEPGANGNRDQGINLPPLLVAHLGRNENGQSPQSSLTSIYRGHQPSTNIGGNIPLTDYPLPDGLKKPSRVGSYDGKGYLDNYLHLFEGAIHMQKWAMPVAYHMFTYTLKDSARMWWNSQKADLPTTYKGLMEKTYTLIKAREVATNGALNDRREGFDRSKKNSPWDNNREQKNRNSSRDMTKYCHFYENHGHDTNDCRELTHQIEEAVKSEQLSHLVKGIKNGKIKVPNNQRGDGKKEKDTTLVEAPIFMISRGEPTERRVSVKPMYKCWGITFPPVDGNNNSSAPAGILRKVKDQTWVANPVMVKKSDKGWRMCVDFTDINKACPKDCYPLSEIDWKVESLSGFWLKCFLDAYKGYHQIQMAEDEEKTAFFTGEGTFCYRKMPFGLKKHQGHISKAGRQSIQWPDWKKP